MAQTTLTEELFARGALMGLHIGRWTAVKKMSPNDMLLDKVNQDAIYLGHKKLLPKKALERLVELEGKARTALASNSMEFPIAGARFVTYSSMPAIIARLETLKREWNQEIDELVSQYPRLRERQLKELEKQALQFRDEEMKKFSVPIEPGKTVSVVSAGERAKELDVWLAEQKKQNESFYPPENKLREKFSFTWRMFQISALNGINELDAAEVKAAQDRLKADLAQWVQTAASAMHLALGEAAANAKNMLEKNGKLTPRNIKPLFDAFESFLAVDFTGKSTFRETIDTIKSKFLSKNPDGTYNLPAMADALSNESSRAEFNGLLGTMSDLALQDTADQAGIRSLQTDFGRLIEF